MLEEQTRDRRAERRKATRAEILEAAWDIVRAEGLAALNMRDVAQRVGMRAPSLYGYFDSKHAIYDAMFLDGAQAFRDMIVAVPTQNDVRGEARGIMRGVLAFAVEDLARYQLMFTRAIPGFEPSPEAYAPSVGAVDHVRSRFASHGITDAAAIDLWTSVGAGLASQQLANEPETDRWIRLADEAVDMYLDHLTKTGRLPRRRSPKGPKG
jgi:AcrR family transcriptional regulator